MQAFPVYNQRTDLELSTKGSAIDACNITFIYPGRWIGAGWFTQRSTRSSRIPSTRRPTGIPTISSAARKSQMKNAKGETFAFTTRPAPC